MITAPQVVFPFCGNDHVLTVQQALDLLEQLTRSIEAIKVECPTCHAKVLPDRPCICADQTLRPE